MEEMKRELWERAVRKTQDSYAPYSGFCVGAALLGTDGVIYEGCNVENAAFGAGICAERNALYHAVSNGCTTFHALAVAGGKKVDGDIRLVEKCMPCGICRQALSEFCDGSLMILFSEQEWCTLADLFPDGFGKENLS